MVKIRYFRFASTIRHVDGSEDITAPTVGAENSSVGENPLQKTGFDTVTDPMAVDEDALQHPTSVFMTSCSHNVTSAP